jgi:hypothetical protein
MHNRVLAGICAALVVTALAACSESGYHAAMHNYARTTDPQKIIVYVTTGSCDTLDRTETKETDSTVTVEVRVRQASADKPCGTIAEKELAVEVRLAKPLGTRTVHGAPDTPPVLERTTPAPR